MATQIVKYRITGISPLLMHRPGAMRLSGAASLLGTKNIPTPEQEAENGVYRGDDGVLYVEGMCFRAAIIGPGGAASGRKIGKRTANQLISAGFFVQSTRCPLYHAQTLAPIKEYKIDTRRVMIGTAGVLRSRPLVDHWACDLIVELDTDFVAPSVALELLNIAGKIAGVLDFRPQKKGIFGRFAAELIA